jgi:hypothetical protein
VRLVSELPTNLPQLGAAVEHSNSCSNAQYLRQCIGLAASRGLSEAAATDLAEQAAKRATQASLQRLTQQELAEAAGTKLLTAVRCTQATESSVRF